MAAADYFGEALSILFQRGCCHLSLLLGQVWNVSWTPVADSTEEVGHVRLIASQALDRASEDRLKGMLRSPRGPIILCSIHYCFTPTVM